MYTLPTILLLSTVGLLVLVCVFLVCLIIKNNKQLSNFKKQQQALNDNTQLIINTFFNERVTQNETNSELQFRNSDRIIQHMTQQIATVVQSQNEMIDRITQQNYQNTQVLDNRQLSFQQSIQESLNRTELQLSRMRSENDAKLEQMRQTVEEKLQQTLEKRLNDSFAQVSTRLEQVYKSLGEMHSLATGVGDIKKMLTNVKTRGVWGEMQLEALLSEVLTTAQYSKNVAVQPGTRERVEFAIHLPGKTQEHQVYLPIDSKFPSEDYTRIVNASQANDQTALLVAQKAFVASIKTEATRIQKYIVPPYTTDFAVMFLPLEGLYAEVMRNTELVSQLQSKQRILIAGPSTLLALLNSLQMGFRTLAIEQRSHEVWRLLGAVKTDFGNFAQVLEKTQEKLRQATESIDTAFIRTRTIQRKLKEVESFEPHDNSTIQQDLKLESDESLL